MNAASATRHAWYPSRAPIDAYGNGGFRFAGMSHKGSLLCLPSGMHGWLAANVGEFAPADAARLVSEGSEIDFVLIGSGPEIAAPPDAVRDVLASSGLSFDVMNTGAACRTYNVMLAEQRRVAAALIAVD